MNKIQQERERELMAHKVYDVLVLEAGAADRTLDRISFIRHWPKCREYRFCGDLGSGGKVWAGGAERSPYVTCYPEDKTPERERIIDNVNYELAYIARSFS